MYRNHRVRHVVAPTPAASSSGGCGVAVAPRDGKRHRLWATGARRWADHPLAEGGPMNLVADTVRNVGEAPVAPTTAARRSYARLAPAPEPPNLVDHQRTSFHWFVG